MNNFNRMVYTAVMAATLVMPAMAMAAEDHSTVNKSIKIGMDAVVGDVESVNGSVRIGDGSSVNSVETVNGSIKIGSGVGISHDISAVNGAISLHQGCEVGGNIETVNGGITLERTLVSGGVETVNGQISILDGSEINGDVVVRQNKGWSLGKRKPVPVEIGENVVVHGNLVFKQPVRLRLHESARVGEIIGDEVEMLGDS
jgi:predicted acyltransferase (DUF342 family)